VSRTLKGEQAARVTVKQFGRAEGTIGRVPGVPTYRQGEELVVFLRPETGDEINTNLLGPDPSGVTTEVAAFWLLSSGIAILLTARGAVRGSLGALLMLTGTQLLVRLVPGPQLALTLLLAWLQVVVALAGAFLIVNQRAAREA